MEKPTKNITIIVCALILLSAISIFQNYSLKNDIQNLRSTVDNMSASTQNNIQSIYGTVSTMLEEEASILAYQNYTEGKLDTDSLTVPVDFSVTPKEYTSATTAAIWHDGKSYPMSLNAGEFQITVNIPVVSNSNDIKVVFTDGNTKRTELLDFYGDYAEKYLNTYSCYLDGISWSSTDSTMVFQLSNCSFHLEPKYYDYKITSDQSELLFNDMVFHVDVNGKEVFSKDIDTSNAKTNGEFDGAPSLMYNLLTNKEITVPANGTFDIYLTYVDAYGLTHKNSLYNARINSDGQTIEDYYSQDFAEIYNSQGELIYSNNQ